MEVTKQQSMLDETGWQPIYKVVVCTVAACAGGASSGRAGCALTARRCARAAGWRAAGRAAAACSACPAGCASMRARTLATAPTAAGTRYCNHTLILSLYHLSCLHF